ncbi:general secretion pathway protein GspB [Vibrio gangliei]|uniref:general secretion pathway protein GspB n=1 Tax=Vibrio gangliei TaxID=2077090 RepID=UPI000D01DC1D|nr:general secretion pathway protein GspB [Vibrio gangliei]
MSQVMNALQKSEQAYQAQMAPHYAAGQPRQLQPVKPGKGIMTLLLLLPLLVVLAWLGYQSFIAPKALSLPSQQPESSQKQVVSQSKSASSAAATVEHVKTPTSLNVVTILPYPTMPEAKALPGDPIVPAPVKVSRRTEVMPVSNTTDKTSSSPSRQAMTPSYQSAEKSQDWNVDDLDLSGLSPELAQRFQTALKGSDISKGPNTSAATKPKATAIEPPQDAINLIGHESDYRGRLPKMNFETHMYSSKADSRWIKVNGNNVHEGEWVIDKLVKLEQILPGSLIILFDNQHIQIPALYEWAG